MIMRKVRGQPRIAQGWSPLVIHYIVMQHTQGPPGQASTCSGPSEFVSDYLNDPKEALEKIMWSDETKINLSGINSTCCVKKKDNIQSHLNCEAWDEIMPWRCFSCCKED